MTQQVLSTTEVNLILRKVAPSIYVSVKDLLQMGFKPVFQTSVATYWDKSIPALVEQKLVKSQEQPKEVKDSNYEKGYAAGYRARAKKEWRTIAQNELAELIDSALDQSDFVFDIGWLAHKIDELLKAKNHG